MKISADMLKSIDYKKLALNHAEKLVVGLIGLLVALLFLMPLVTGRFSGYAETPEQLASQAAETHDEIIASIWPVDEKTKYQGTEDLQKKLGSLSLPVPGDLYRGSIELAPPLYSKKEPRKDPDWLKVFDLFVVSGRGIFEVPPPKDSKAASEQGAEGISIDADGGTEIPLGQEDDQQNVPAEFRRRAGAANAGSGFDLATGTAPGSTQGGAGGGSPSGMMEQLRRMGSMMGGGGGGGGLGAGSSPSSGRGYRYALLTGIFNIRTQRARIAEALSISEVNLDPRMINFDLLGFEVARKEGTQPWPNVEDHQILDINRSMEVLMEMAGFDFDPVGYGVTDSQITSPLPPRIVGEWGPEVAHPKISNYLLTDDGKELNEFLTGYLVERDDQKKLKDSAEKPIKYGFGEIQRNIKGMANDTFGGSGGGSSVQDFSSMYAGMSSMARGAGGNKGAQQGAQQLQIQGAVDRITAAGTLLLFRYFDFDVEPGRTYQYRVRLIFQNPNYNVRVSELEDPDSRLDEVRKTPWSQLTQPVTVLKDTEYFLTKVSVPAGKKSEESSLLVFQWKPEIGTVVSSPLSSRLGQYIGGEKMTDVLNPAPQTFEKEKVKFTSDDLLVDSSQGIDVNFKDHLDLKLPKRLTGKGRLRILDEALVQDSSGRLFAIDPFSSTTEKQNALQRLEWQNQPWQFLKDQAEDGELADSESGSPAGRMMGMMQQMRGGNKKSGRRGRSRRNRNLRRRSLSDGVDSPFRVAPEGFSSGPNRR